MKPVIEIKQLGKKYRIHKAEPYLALRDTITNSVKNIFRSRYEDKRDFWALQDINLKVEAGERIGIIGRNGAGKSTLLKILSRITRPTTGEAIIRGRLASLLEVGTGFHPELTGRENIYLNGSILGLKKWEIDKQFDAIVDFSGVEEFLDTPLKNYSSGMQLRLAFAVAAHLEPEVLLIDEVLAVGDMEFQKKCIGKMEEISREHGRTILFVSHNMAAIQNLCDRVIVLKQGTVLKNSTVQDSILYYYQLSKTSGVIKINDTKPTYVSDIKIDSRDGNIYTFERTTFSAEVTSTIELENIFIGFGINDITGGRLFTLFSKLINKKYTVKKGKNIFSVDVGSLPLKPGTYALEIYIGDGVIVYDYYNNGFNFEVIVPNTIQHHFLPDDTQGSFMVNQYWK